MALPDWSTRISRDDPRLLSDQVAEVLRDEIKAGRLTGRIPSEIDMAQTVFGVSRVTIRRAVAVLTEEGLIVIQLGRGMFAVPANRRRGRA